jgi:hypothetical protein
MWGKEGFSLGTCSTHTSLASNSWVVLGSPVPCSYITIYSGFTWQLLTIVKYFKQWRLELKGLLFLIYILTDYKNLQYFIIIKQLI